MQNGNKFRELEIVRQECCHLPARAKSLRVNVQHLYKVYPVSSNCKVLLDSVLFKSIIVPKLLFLHIIYFTVTFMQTL